MPTLTSDERFFVCTPQEQLFLREFAVDQDLIRSTKAAFKVQTDEQARTYGLTVLGRDRIKGLVRDHVVKRQESTLPTVEELRHLYMDLYHVPAATVREKLQALTAYERVSGYNKPKQKGNTDDGFSALDDLSAIDND